MIDSEVESKVNFLCLLILFIVLGGMYFQEQIKKVTSLIFGDSDIY